MNKSMTDYRINILYSEEAKQHIAEIPDLRGCSASGETPVEAVREVLIGKRLWLDSRRVYGEPIPEPRYRPAI